MSEVLYFKSTFLCFSEFKSIKIVAAFPFPFALIFLVLPEEYLAMHAKDSCTNASLPLSGSGYCEVFWFALGLSGSFIYCAFRGVR